MEPMLSDGLRTRLLAVAREGVSAAAAGKPPAMLARNPGEEPVWENGASFVTLTARKSLRGCIGSLEARQPLIADVQEHAMDAAVRDYRFQPVRPEEVERLRIEVSVLTKPSSLLYKTPGDLPGLLRPNIDGVILTKGGRKATFLPQVWEQIPDPQEFLSHLCAKMGVSPDVWKSEMLQVFTYQVECFEDE